MLRNARAESIRLSGCVVPGIDAIRLHLQGDLYLAHGFTSKGRVRLPGAHIGGDLYAKGACVTSTDGPALTADGMTVEGGVWLNGDDTARFEATGEICLRDATIHGPLRCRGGRFTNPEGSALDARGITVRGYVDLAGGERARFEATGEVILAVPPSTANCSVAAVSSQTLVDGRSPPMACG